MGRHYPDTSDINAYFINVYWILPVQKRKKERINKEKRPLTLRILRQVPSHEAFQLPAN